MGALSKKLLPYTTCTAIYPKNWTLWLCYSKTGGPKSCEWSQKVAPRSPVNIGLDKLDRTIAPRIDQQRCTLLKENSKTIYLQCTIKNLRTLF